MLKNKAKADFKRTTGTCLDERRLRGFGLPDFDLDCLDLALLVWNWFRWA